ncbi:hypothetical protein SDRG_08159 [Saprolegnia diclina VS20]|uniref:Uncharacterized protein n=1 Tax=Saprolegnia diclina (strain VS20) TaxID=1156394 RepID=T0Q917_SAPDV|nr:hypothetical protein SDRG_08159 [Saprolegnia diclina VS20]EQC34389.1 hypothetical protein SDRG_08159 [Saprolegnia diclina VS20]|eukprot:XP_008612251.1 hypothetical protein SDRG_08159 [Saprolegnia diclina VS20]
MSITLTTDNRVAMWLLSPIALQILDYLDDADDAHAFLQAAPNGSLDDALDALRTLLAMDVELSLWPTPYAECLDEVYSISASVVTRALPLFREIVVTRAQDQAAICHSTELAPTTTVRCDVQGATSVRAALGKWLPNLVDLRVTSDFPLDVAAVLTDSVSTCHGLRAVTMRQSENLEQAAFDAALTAVLATCSQVERIWVGSSSLSPMSDCKSLVAWLALPTARHLELEGTDFYDEVGVELAVAMLASSTLETTNLSAVPSLTRAILSPSSPPLPSQLRHLIIFDYALKNDYDFNDDDDDDDVDPPTALGEADVAALAAKISRSRLESLDVWLQDGCDATPVVSVLPQLPALTKLALQAVHLTWFPKLRHLWHLELFSVTFSDAAIESLAAFLGSSPKTVQLDLGCDPLPDPHANIIFGALPQWLSRRGTACEIRLAIKSDVCAEAFATALAQTRNSHTVKITIASAGLSLAAKQQLVAALALTSRMTLVFSSGGHRCAEDDAILEAYGRKHHLYGKQHFHGGAKSIRFHSPCTVVR